MMAGENSEDKNSLITLAVVRKSRIVVPGYPHHVIQRDVRSPDVFTSEEDRLTYLSFPADADLECGKISVLAPIRTAMSGYRVGDTIKWQVPAGTRKFKVKSML